MSRKRNEPPSAEQQDKDDPLIVGDNVGDQQNDHERGSSKKVRKAAAVEPATVTAVVTPAAANNHRRHVDESPKQQVRRSLFPTPGPQAIPVTPARPPKKEDENDETPSAKKRLIFGRLVDEIAVQGNVRQVYGIIRKLTGSIGGNASHGPIYGELTMGSMQKMVNLMKLHTNFDCNSRFIDVGSGIGKPSLHVAQDPGVEFSYGIEVDLNRWILGMNCLNGVLTAAHSQQTSQETLLEEARILNSCIFEHGDVRQAKTFDPFTHVYMFSIGFPPPFWIDLAGMWNRSESGYLICYHGPKDIIDEYGFNVELLAQTSTSMHGSKEGHMGYIYRRCGFSSMNGACDPFFGRAWERVKSGEESLRKQVEVELHEFMSPGPSTRAGRRRKASKDA